MSQLTTAIVPATQPASVAETLRRAKEKIGTPDRWCKHALAKTSRRLASSDVSPDNPKAGAWCAVGAIRVVDGPYEEAALDALAMAVAHVEQRWGTTGHITDFNDDPYTRHRDVMRMFDKAIARAEVQP